MSDETNFKEWNEPVVRNNVFKIVENQLLNGDCFELIDGDNLEFKGLLIQNIIENRKQDSVIVVCVVGS
jgi:hypothetical protein